MASRSLFVACVAMAATASLSVAVAQELPPDFRLEPVVGGLTDPSALAGTPDGRILIAERTTGNLRQLRNGQLSASPLCTVAVNATNEGGLLGVAVHPQFLDNHWVYLYYTDLGSGKNRVTRFTVGIASCGDATTILGDLGAGPSFLRNGGGIGFGPDGKLYVATGDMEDPSNGQTASTLAGKVLRANDDGTIPADNPDPASLVYAVGVRDGSGLSINPSSGQVYVADSGDDVTSAYDELDAAAAGGNLGWDDESGPGVLHDGPLVSWLPTVGLRGIATYTGQLYPDLASDGLDNDHDAFGADEKPGVGRTDDNGVGTCIGSQNNNNACTTSAECEPLNSGEPSHFCELRDDPAEYCPGGVPYGDDACGSSGAAGVDEPDESYVNNVFLAGANGIERAVMDGPGLDQLSSWSTFLDATAFGDCPTGWTGIMAGRDGMLYAVATNGGGPNGALYRVTNRGAPGPREVSPRDSYFPLLVGKTPIPNRVDLYFEDLREDGMQPRWENNVPQPPEREYDIWRGTIGDWSSHAPTPYLEGVPGTEVNSAVRKQLVLVSGDAMYFLVSARGNNLEGTLGTGNDGERPGPTFDEICFEQGFHLPSTGWPLFTCGWDFTLADGEGVLHSMYEEYRGHPIVLDFSAIWCAPCQSEANIIESLYEDYADRDVVVLTVLMDEDSQSLDFPNRPTPAECRNWEDRPPGFLDHTFECWVDPNPNGSQQAWPKYNKWGAVPTNVVMDTGLLVVYTGGGYDEATIRTRLNQMLRPDSCLH